MEEPSDDRMPDEPMGAWLARVIVKGLDSIAEAIRIATGQERGDDET